MLQEETKRDLSTLPNMLQEETKRDLSTFPNMLQEETKRGDKRTYAPDVRKRDDKRTYAPDVRKKDDKRTYAPDVRRRDDKRTYALDVRKRDDKRTYAPGNTTKPISDSSLLKLIHKEKKVVEKLSTLKNPDDKTYSFKDELTFDEFKKPTDLKKDTFFKSKHERIDLDDVNSLIDRINSEILEKDNIVDLGNNKEIYFRDLANFLYDIKDGKISDFNKEREYEKRLKNTEKKLANKTKFSRSTRLYEQYINRLKLILFSDKKSSGKGLNVSLFIYSFV